MDSRTPIWETSDFWVPRDSLNSEWRVWEISPTPRHPAPATTLERIDLTGACLRSLQDERVEEGVFHVQELGAEKEIITTARRAHLPSPPLGIQTLDLRAESQGQHESGAVRGHRLGQWSRARGGRCNPDCVPRSCSGPAAWRMGSRTQGRPFRSGHALKPDTSPHPGTRPPRNHALSSRPSPRSPPLTPARTLATSSRRRRTVQPLPPSLSGGGGRNRPVCGRRGVLSFQGWRESELGQENQGRPGDTDPPGHLWRLGAAGPLLREGRSFPST